MATPFKSNVIPFPARARVTAERPLGVWTCSCGSLIFYLYSNGSVQCADCLEESQRMKCAADDSDSD